MINPGDYKGFHPLLAFYFASTPVDESLNLLTNAALAGDYIRRLALSGRQGDIFLTDEL